LKQKAIDIAPLDRLGWLSEQPRIFQDWVARVGRWRTYDEGQFIYHAGDNPDGIYGLASGGINLSFPLIADEPVLFYRAEIGFWIGDSAELASHKRTISLIAASQTRLLHLPSHEIKTLLTAFPEHWRSFYELSARNAHTAMVVLSESLALTVRARVCRRLLALTEQDPNLRITQDDLAKLVGVTRATLRRCIIDLAAAGGLETGYRELRVASTAVLARYRDEQ
jgi:CRP/FNR family transcriptional regulator, cyclic AMP receptor protein